MEKYSESYCFCCKHQYTRSASAAGCPDAVEAILEERKRYPADIAREVFDIHLISLSSKAGMFGHTADTFRQLPTLSCTRSIMFFNALLSTCADAGDSDRMATAFREISAADRSIVSNLLSYNTLIRALCE
ncbi:putative Pentatricopeptide repeat-containing protein, mitochondrial [Cocos nucifera]|nr:putative Pentatricopeptide repeat-containing protein, mitochondrial [Cocos nucifera]